jgi:parallel beta-helix repeat protein
MMSFCVVKSMSRKLVPLMGVTVIVLGVLVAAFRVETVDAQLHTIFIRANGDVEPSWVGTYILRAGDVYVFTRDVVVDGDATGLVIERDNMTLEGVGYRLSRPPSGTIAAGIELQGRRNVTIQNLIVSDFSDGIFVNASSHVRIVNSTVHDQGGEAIRLQYTSNSSLIRNTITNNHLGVRIAWSTDVEIDDNTVTFNSGGIALGGDNNTVHGNVVTATYIGVDVFGSSNDIRGNNVTGCTTGFFFGNTAVHNVVAGNNIVSNEWGLYFEQSSNHTVTGNRIANNTYGLELDGYADNLHIYHNTFMNNTYHMRPRGQPNVLDNGVEGNYWNNYTGSDQNHDGIGDTWHTIAENNVDHYPLMGPFHRFDALPGMFVDLVSNSTIAEFEYCAPCNYIRITVANTTAGQTHGFLRGTIPKGVMAPPYAVVINEGFTEVLHFNQSIAENATHAWIYFAYEHSTNVVRIIPEFPSLVLLPLLIALTLIGAGVRRARKSLSG